MSWVIKDMVGGTYVSYSDAAREYVRRGCISSRILKLKDRPKCPTCGRAVSK